MDDKKKEKKKKIKEIKEIDRVIVYLYEKELNRIIETFEIYLRVAG